MPAGAVGGHRAGLLAGQSSRSCNRGALLLPHLPSEVMPGRSTRLAVMQPHQIPAFQDSGANRGDLPSPFPLSLAKLPSRNRSMSRTMKVAMFRNSAAITFPDRARLPDWSGG